MTVKIDGCFSKLRPVNAGAPQGSVLGTYIFNVGMDDLDEGYRHQHQTLSYELREGDLAFLELSADNRIAHSTPKRRPPSPGLPDVSSIDNHSMNYTILPKLRNVPPSLTNRVDPTKRIGKEIKTRPPPPQAKRNSARGATKKGPIQKNAGQIKISSTANSATGHVSKACKKEKSRKNGTSRPYNKTGRQQTANWTLFAYWKLRRFCKCPGPSKEDRRAKREAKWHKHQLDNIERQIEKYERKLKEVRNLRSSLGLDGVTLNELSFSNDARENSDDWRTCLLYTSPSPRDRQKSRMPSSA